MHQHHSLLLPALPWLPQLLPVLAAVRDPPTLEELAWMVDAEVAEVGYSRAGMPVVMWLGQAIRGQTCLYVGILSLCENWPLETKVPM